MEEFDLENPLTNNTELHSNSSHSLFFIESEHTPSISVSISLISFRQETISSISQVSSCSFFSNTQFLSYLAVNYLDRFISSNVIPVITSPQNKPWLVKLLAVSCVSLADKMMNITTDSSLKNIQKQGNVNVKFGFGFGFDPRTIQRMERLILGALKWRMRSVTPFSFLSLFAAYFKLKDPPLLQALRARATQIILRAQIEVKMMGVKPSVVAASALLAACHELFPLQFSCFRDGILSCSYVNKEVMAESYKEMQELAMEEYESVMDRSVSSSSSDTPVNVLDHRFSSSSSEDQLKATGTIFSTASSSSRRSSAGTGEVVIITPESEDRETKKKKTTIITNGNKSGKRRKTNDYC